MYNGEKTEWINQREFQYKDVEYGSASTMEVSTSINTKDFKYYSQLTLNIVIYIFRMLEDFSIHSKKLQQTIKLLLRMNRLSQTNMGRSI